MVSKSNQTVAMNAEEKNMKMSEERAFLTKLLESALAGQTSKVIEYTLEYSATNSIPTHQVVSQFKDGSERTALHFACQSQPTPRQQQQNDNEDDIVVHLLTKSQFPASAISSLLQSKDKDGLTPLMFACQTIHPSSYRRIQCILTIAGQTAALTKSHTGATPLHYASAAGASRQIITALYHAGESAIHTKSLRGGTPLHWASGISPPLNYEETLGALIEDCAADVDAPNDDGICSLILASAAGNDAHAKVLVQHGADRGVILEGGVTVYHIAADLNLVGTLAAMMDVDRDAGECKDEMETIGHRCLQMKNINGETPLDLAVEEGHVGCVMLLMNEADEKVTRAYIQEEQRKSKLQTKVEPVTPKEIKEDPTKPITFKSSIAAIGTVEQEVEKSALETLKMTRIDDPTKDHALQLKSEGNTHFAKKDYTSAIKSYTDAIHTNPLDATFYSNRSACHMAVTNYSEALRDAIRTRTIKSDWPKGFYRVAIARLALERFDDAAEAAWGGLQLDNENDELKCLLQKCVKKGRKSHLEKSTSKS